MPIFAKISRPLVSVSAVFGIAALALSVSSPANAACAVSVGNGEGPTKAIAEKKAKRDARMKAGGVRPQTASFSEPVCYVADDFKRGIATYGCEVQYSFCTAPAVTPVAKPVHPDGRKHGKGHKHWKKHHRHSHSHKKGRIAFGAWRKSRTEIACLRFNAKASARTADKASSLANGALIKSIAANVGGRFSHSNVAVTGASCSQTGNHKITCKQSARYCF